MKKLLATICTIAISSSVFCADVIKTVTTTTANTLKTQLPIAEWGSISNLTVIGPIGNADIVFLSNVAKGTKTLKILNLSEATEIATIDKNAFASITSINSISLPSSVQSISEKAFMDCINLNSIHFASNSIQTIGDRAFSNDSLLTTITFPASLQTIAGSALNGCANLEEINVEPGSEYFSSLAGVLISMQDETLVKYPMARNEEDYVIPEGVLTIGEGSFSNSKLLKTIEFSNSIKTIGKEAFLNCNGLTDIILGDKTETINDYAFKNCKNLKTISFPNKLKRMGDGILTGCCQLNSIRCEAILPPTYNSLVSPFKSEDVSLCSVPFASCTLSVPNKSVAQYTSAKGWNEFVNIEGFQVGK